MINKHMIKFLMLGLIVGILVPNLEQQLQVFVGGNVFFTSYSVLWPDFLNLPPD